MIVLWILLGLFALIFLLLSLPLKIDFSFDSQADLQYRVKYLFFTLADSQAPEKPQAPSPKKPETAPKKKESKGSGLSSLLSFLGLDEISSPGKFKAALAEEGLVETLHQLFSAISNLFSRLGRTAKKGVFRKFHLEITAGDGDAADAALSYGALCAAVYPLVALVTQTMKVRKPRVNIRCDYTREETDFRFEGQLNYRPRTLLAFFLGLFFRYLKESVKKEGAKA